MKICKVCGVEKSIDNFYKFTKNEKEYRSSYCSNCARNINKKYRKCNSEKISTSTRNKRINNLELAREKDREGYRKRDKTKLKSYVEDYRAKHRDKFYDYNRNYFLKNKDEILDRKGKWGKVRRDNNPILRLRLSISARTSLIFRKKELTKNKKFLSYIGCSLVFLVDFIQKQFTNEISWNNYGTYWNIDHIIPMDYADSEEEMYKLAHYLNLRPLRKEENFSKHNKMSKYDVSLYLTRMKEYQLSSLYIYVNHKFHYYETRP